MPYGSGYRTAALCLKLGIHFGVFLTLMLHMQAK